MFLFKWSALYANALLSPHCKTLFVWVGIEGSGALRETMIASHVYQPIKLYIWKDLLKLSLIRLVPGREFYCSQSRYTSSSSSLSPPSRYTPNLKKLYHKDWLSPNELVEIFKYAEATSVLSLFDHAASRKDFKPNETLYSVVVTKLGQAGNFEAIASLLAQIKTQRTLQLSDEFFYNVIKTYGNVGGQINWAIDTLLDMPNCNCWPSVKTFNFVLNLLVSNKQFEVIPEVFMAANKLGVEIDACCLNILIKGLCENGSLEDAFKLLDEFPKQGCVPNEKTYSTIMRGLCEHGRVDEAFELLDRVDEDKVRPDTIMFNVLISGLWKEGRDEDAIRILDRMRLRGCEPNSGSYQQVLYALLAGKRSAQAKEVMNRMITRGWRPSFVSFKMMFMAFCEERLLGDADWVLKQMVKHGFVPRMGMWRKALRKIKFEDGIFENLFTGVLDSDDLCKI